MIQIQIITKLPSIIIIIIIIIMQKQIKDMQFGQGIIFYQDKSFTFIMWIVDIAVAVAPVIGYYSQLQLIKKQKSIGNFSIDVCAILMISAILRIYFWITTRFAINLLFQSIFIIIIQAFLLNQCIKLSPRPKDEGTEEKFWRWNTFDQYIKFLTIFAGALALSTFLSKIFWIPFYGTLIGLASMSIQATLGIPQLLRNNQTKSVEGLSFFMIFTWFAGDFLKTIYFVSESQPFQFVMCGVVQLTVDILIILQIINYKKIDLKLYSPVGNETPGQANYEIKETIQEQK